MLQSGDIINNKYEVIELIGHGGMSTVYKARDLRTGVLLAIKDVERCKENGKQMFEERLTEEGQMLKRLSNTHLPKIYDIIENQNSFMLVMDFVEGESLDKVIARCGPQQEAYIYNWGIQICNVFSYLHSQDPPIIYRDMKPANIILQPNGKIMMIDFGTARTLKNGTELFGDTICIGTEGFAAPEQYGGLGQSDARTDIFCLGATLYNMITGHSPYEYPKGIIPLEKWSPELGKSPLNAIINKCTQKSPIDRYQTAADLCADLELAAAGKFKVNKDGQIVQSSWQRQVLKTSGALSGLSGLLQRVGKGEEKKEKALNSTQTRSFTIVSSKSSHWQPVEIVRLNDNIAQSASAAAEDSSAAYEAAIDKDENEIWNKLMVAATVTAVVFLLLGAVFGTVGNSGLSSIMIVFAVASLCLAGIGIFMFLKNLRQR